MVVILVDYVDQKLQPCTFLCFSTFSNFSRFFCQNFMIFFSKQRISPKFTLAQSSEFLCYEGINHMKNTLNLSNNSFFQLTKLTDHYTQLVKRFHLSNFGVCWKNQPNSQCQHVILVIFKHVICAIECCRLYGCVLQSI